MTLIVYLKFWFIISLTIDSIAEEIRLPSDAYWDQHGLTIAGWANGSNGSLPMQLAFPFGISITDDDVLYVSDTFNDRVVFLLLNSTSNVSIIGSGLGNGTNQFNQPYDLFIRNNLLYVIDLRNYRLKRMSLDGSNPLMVLDLSGLHWPYYLFVDYDNNIYLSDTYKHRVLLFLSNQTNFTVVAGTGVPGYDNNQFNRSYGIFVTENATIYVADCHNHRIMKWQLGASVGILVAGTGMMGNHSTQLSYPTQVIVDTNGFMYISEAGNTRITRWTPYSNAGICIVACTGTAGVDSTELVGPHSLTFDKYGSLYVCDRYNNRIQKFQILQKPSYNQPKFSACATWNPNAVTFAGKATIGNDSHGLYIDSNNTIYVADRRGNRVQVWLEENETVSKTISGGLDFPNAVVVSISGDIYVDNGINHSRVDMWMKNTTPITGVMNIIDQCFSLFIDTNDTLYCSNNRKHQVVKMSLRNMPNEVIRVAGDGTPGALPNMLNGPNGIYVDTDFGLYVADWWNDRIQYFSRGQFNATTLAGNGAPETIALLGPSAVILDADRYLFISDSNHGRIVRSGPDGFHCLLGCISRAGSASNQLDRPYSLGFDSYGNLFVADFGNARIQKFLLATNSCVPSYNRPTFSRCATWNPNGTTIANVTSAGSAPMDVFVDINDTVYIPNRFANFIQVWSDRNQSFIGNISAGFIRAPFSIFVTLNGDIYSDNGAYNFTVNRRTLLGSNTNTIVMRVTSVCLGIFIDINDYLYCSTVFPHQVAKHLLGDNLNKSIIVAGTGNEGNTSDTLRHPLGIFVDLNLDLYVADCGNDRIQLFPSGQLNGITVPINGSSGTFTLGCPAEVVLDMDGYLFIADNHNNRILGSGPEGFRCIVGCTGTNGSAPHQLYFPHGLGFDSKGNLFVIEYGNSRLQKFFLSTNSCDETTTYPMDTTVLEQTSIVTTTMSMITSPAMTSNQSCSSPVVILIPSTSSFTSPLSFRRSQDFYISSFIQLNCNNSLFPITRWTIHNCTSINCSTQIPIDSTVPMTFSELYIPARILPFGIYELKLTVSMINSSSSAYVQIILSGITANLVPYGTSMITRGYEQDLTLDPGTYSIDPDTNTFNATDWIYKYYCRIYGHSAFPNLKGSLLAIDDSTIDPNNPSCLSNRTDNQSAWKFNNLIESSLTIISRTLLPNRTYQFMVQMENRRNSSIRATGYLLVRVDNTYPQMIVVGCVISTMCVPNVEFQLVNPTTQVALFSLCQGSCSIIQHITWNVYYGSLNSASNVTEWIPFKQITSYENIWFYGRNTGNFTATSELFQSYSRYHLWRFEVIYTFASEQSSSSLNFVINQKPENGSCSINPPNGTTMTLFTISCPDWFDQDEIKSYSLYSFTTNDAILIAFSSVSQFTVRLPCKNGNQSQIDLFISIRDQLDCATEVNLRSVIVTTDSSSMSLLMDTFQHSPESLFTNPIVQLLSSGNQNTVGQIITSISQQFNQITTQSLDDAVSKGVPASSVSISSLSTNTLSPIQSIVFNPSALTDYENELNSYANIRDYLVQFTTNLLISTSQSIILQSTSLAQLTQSTNQLTRSTAIMASERCYQLAQSLHDMSTRISYEDLQSAVNQISQCTSNVLTAINGPLQGRTKVLSLDPSRANQLPSDYDTDIESAWSNLNLFADGNDFSLETIEKNRNIYYQKQAANQIHDQTSKTMALLTSAMNIHRNIGQQQTINASSVFMSFQTISREFLSEKRNIEGIGNVRIDLPSNLHTIIANDQTLSLQLIVQPLASADASSMQSHTNLSRSITFSILDGNGREQFLIDHPYRFLIPRDPTMTPPALVSQNVTSLNTTPHHLLFHFHSISINQTKNLTNSIHIEIQPFNDRIAYFFIARFDRLPQMNDNHRWTFLCPTLLSRDQIYRIHFDNRQTQDHHSLIFGLRELNQTEFDNHCSNLSINASQPQFNQPFHFLFNYALRVYSSGCYYLDQNNQWQSDGLIVGSQTNINETECFSTIV